MKKHIFPFSLAVLLLAGCTQSQKEQTVENENKDSLQIKEVNEQTASFNTKTEKTMYPELSTYIESALSGVESIPKARKDELKKVALFVKTKKQSNEPANLTFICTHNSRRSHMSQIWAASAAAFYDIEEGINTYSGGTEATAFNPRAVAAMERAGFKIDNPGGENPAYKVTYAENGPVMECFSKKYDHSFNADKNFVAIMTCSEADQNCPFIPGASLRIPIPYVDPKESDGTDEEQAMYDERCKQIATEMLYLMSQVKA